MTTEVIPASQQAMTQQRPAELRGSILEAIARAASDPNVDVAKMERLLDMQLKVIALASEASFSQAMQRLKPQLPRIAKNGAIMIPGKEAQRFIRYSDLHAVVAPLLNREGFVLSYTSKLIPDLRLMEITAKFAHIDGHSDSGSVFLPLTDKTGSKNEVQGVGSILSYGRRYVLCAYLDIVAEDEDDDGTQGSMKPISEKQVGQILGMIADIKDNGLTFNEELFLHKVMGVDRIEDIMVRDFTKATTALSEKKRKGK